ncbi:hypothetical protein LHK12_22255 [Providencia rettgeri]|nr:hypothetical protein [Providencia rettgeri]
MKRSNSTKMTSSNGSNCPDLTESTTENTQEITTESNSFCQAHAEPDHAQAVLEHFNKVLTQVIAMVKQLWVISEPV